MRTLLVTTLVVAPPAYYAYTTVNRLEAKYPRLRPDAASTAALRSPTFPATHHTPAVDVYGGRVPARALLDQHAPDGSKLSPEEAWARLFLQSPALRLEGKLLGAFHFLTTAGQGGGGGGGGPGDCGERGFHPRQKLLNGVFEVVRPPHSSSSSSSSLPSRLLRRPLAALQQSEPAPLLVQWTCPPRLVGFFHQAAASWGYPWRLMTGGRQEFSVAGEPDRDGTVEVRFACAHDYERVGEEGRAQKTIPEWTARLHRAYAMWLLDERIEALKKKAAAEAEEAEWRNL